MVNRAVTPKSRSATSLSGGETSWSNSQVQVPALAEVISCSEKCEMLACQVSGSAIASLSFPAKWSEPQQVVCSKDFRCEIYAQQTWGIKSVPC
jgi:hypothetical protein